MPAAAPLSGLHHISLQVHDVDHSVAFYRDVLGFRVVQRPDMGFPGSWLLLGNVQLHLIAGREAGPDTTPISSRDNHLAFLSYEIDRVEEALLNAGVRYQVNYQGGTGLRQLFFKDPDGHILEIATYPDGQPPFLEPEQVEQSESA